VIFTRVNGWTIQEAPPDHFCSRLVETNQWSSASVYLSATLVRWRLLGADFRSLQTPCTTNASGQTLCRARLLVPVSV